MIRPASLTKEGDVKRVTMLDVMRALMPVSDGEGLFAADLFVHGSVQAVSNALRHARRYGYVSSVLFGHSGNKSLWQLTPAGRKVVIASDQG